MIEVGRYALRTFHLSYMIGTLGPMGYGRGNQGCWQDGTCTAKCLRKEYGYTRHEAKGDCRLPAPLWHRPPHRACTCGIYGSLDLRSLQRQYRMQADDITAVIAAEGATLIGTVGLRTQYARVVGYRANWPYGSYAQKQFVDAEEFGTDEELLEAFHLPADNGARVDATGPSYWK